MFTPIRPFDWIYNLFTNTFAEFLVLKDMCEEVNPSSTKSSWQDGTVAPAVVSTSIPRWLPVPVTLFKVRRGFTPWMWRIEVGVEIPTPMKP